MIHGLHPLTRTDERERERKAAHKYPAIRWSCEPAFPDAPSPLGGSWEAQQPIKVSAALVKTANLPSILTR